MIPACSGWLSVTGFPFEPDPFNEGELDSDEKYVQRYFEICGNKCLDNYLFPYTTTNAEGITVTELREFRAKHAAREAVTPADRQQLHLCLQQLKEDLKSFLRPRFEMRVLQQARAENLHAANGGETLSDVLDSMARAEFTGERSAIQAIKRIKEGLGSREFIRKTVGEFFHSHGMVARITRKNISVEGSLERIKIRNRPHPDWTGHYYYQVAMLSVGKQLLRRISRKCAQARLRRLRTAEVTPEPGTNAAAETATREPQNATAEVAALDNLSQAMSGIRSILNEATALEKLMPTVSRIDEALNRMESLQVPDHDHQPESDGFAVEAVVEGDEGGAGTFHETGGAGSDGGITFGGSSNDAGLPNEVNHEVRRRLSS